MAGPANAAADAVPGKAASNNPATAGERMISSIIAQASCCPRHGERNHGQ
jgi:hypothetical protein